MDKNWLVGFIEGEGCFTIALNLQKGKRCGFGFSPCFGLQISLKDRKAVEDIRKFVGFGHLELINHENNRKKGKNYQDCFRITINSKEGCNKLREIIKDVEWHSHKKEDFNLWCQFLDMYNTGEHLTIDGMKKTINLREQMNLRGNQLKRNYNYYSKNKILKMVDNRRKVFCKICNNECFGSKNFCNIDCRNKYYNLQAREKRKGNPDDFKYCKICKEKFYRKDNPKGFSNREICLNNLCTLKRNCEKTKKYYNKKNKQNMK